MEQKTILEKLADHNAKKTAEKKKRQLKVKRMFENHKTIEQIVKAVGKSQWTVKSDLRFWGYKIEREKVVHHALIKKWFLEGKAPKEIAVDVGAAIDTVYRSINQQVDRKQIKMKKVMYVYKHRQAGDSLKSIADDLDVAVSTVRRLWDDRVLISEVDREKLNVGNS